MFNVNSTKKILKRIRGITLVSIVIGAGLSTVVISGISYVLISAKSNQLLLDNMNELNDVSRYAYHKIYELLSQTGNRIPNSTTGYFPDYTAAFVESNYGAAGSYSPTGAAISNGIVLGNFTVGGNVQNAWFKMYGNSNGTIKSCSSTETGTTQDFRILLYRNPTTSPTGVAQTSLACAKQIYGQTIANAMANSVDIVPPDYYVNMWITFGVDAIQAGEPVKWLTPDNVASSYGVTTARVQLVRVALMLRTRSPVRSQNFTQDFQFFGLGTLTYNDRYIYRLLIITVPLPFNTSR